jgi:hypothetical protein
MSFGEQEVLSPKIACDRETGDVGATNREWVDRGALRIQISPKDFVPLGKLVIDASSELIRVAV